MVRIKGNADGPNGRNETYTVWSRGVVPRTQLVREVNSGLHDGYHTREINGRKYVVDNPDVSKKDNVDS